jgi:hypothetical protein
MARSAGGETGRSGPFSLLGRRTVAAIVCIALAAAVVGVAATRGGGSKATRTSKPAAPACAHATASVDRPAAVPENLLPPGTALTSRMNLPEGQMLVTGVIPRQFRNAVDYYVNDLPAAGYQLGAGDAEMGEAEALFLGADISGKWKVNAIANCPNAVTLALLVGR